MISKHYRPKSPLSVVHKYTTASSPRTYLLITRRGDVTKGKSSNHDFDLKLHPGPCHRPSYLMSSRYGSIGHLCGRRFKLITVIQYSALDREHV